MNEQHAPHAVDLEPNGRRQRVQKRDLPTVELRASPGEDVLRRAALFAGQQLAIGVPAQPADTLAESVQPFERLRREEAGDDVAADDDQGLVGHIREHRLERGQIAVDVVQRRDPRRRTVRAGASTRREHHGTIVARSRRRPPSEVRTTTARKRGRMADGESWTASRSQAHDRHPARPQASRRPITPSAPG